MRTSHHIWNTVQLFSLADKEGHHEASLTASVPCSPHLLPSLPWMSFRPSNMSSPCPPEGSILYHLCLKFFSLGRCLSSPPLLFSFSKCPLLQKAFVDSWSWSVARPCSLVTTWPTSPVLFLHSPNLCQEFQVRFPRSRAWGWILEQMTNLLRECSWKKFVRECRGKTLSKESALEPELHHWVCPTLRQACWSYSLIHLSVTEGSPVMRDINFETTSIAQWQTFALVLGMCC